MGVMQEVYPILSRKCDRKRARSILSCIKLYKVDLKSARIILLKAMREKIDEIGQLKVV